MLRWLALTVFGLTAVAYVIAVQQQEPNTDRVTPQEGAGSRAPSSASQTDATQEGSAALEGPMRVEMESLFENRRKQWEVLGGRKYPSLMQIAMRLRGDRLDEIVRLGQPIIVEAVDDTGAMLMDVSGYKPRQLESTRLYRPNQADLTYGIELRMRGHLPAREATKITQIQGYINVMYGGEPVTLSFPEPTQYIGRTLEHPLIEEMQIPLKMRLLNPREAGLNVGRGSFVVAFEQGREYVLAVNVYDAWLQGVRTQSSAAQTPDGQDVVVYKMVLGEFNQDCELAFTVYPHLEQDRIPIQFSDLELP